MWRCSDELRARADILHCSSKKDAKHYIGMQLSSVFCYNIVEAHMNSAFLEFPFHFILEILSHCIRGACQTLNTLAEFNP